MTLALVTAAPGFAGQISGDPYWFSGFGSEGVLARFDDSADDKAHDVITHASGKIIAVGETRPSGQDADFALAAFEPTSGAADESGFSGDGLQRTDFNGGDDVALGAAPAANNKFVVVGTSETSENSDRFRLAIARYKANGKLDTTFSGDGMVRTRMRAQSTEDVAHDVVVRGSKVTAAGYSRDPSGSRFALARYTDGGALDSSFGGDGRVLTSFPDDEATASARGIAAAGNGRVVVAGWAFQPASLDDDFALARFRRDGSRDRDFSGDGRVTTDIAGVPDRAHDVAVNGDGSIVAGGFVAGPTDDFAIANYSAAGAPLGDDVIAFAAGGDEVINALAVQPSGKLLAAGESDDRFALFRLLANGNVDTGFSPNDPAGVAYTDFAGATEAAEGMTLAELGPFPAKRAGNNQEQGDPVLAGHADFGSNRDFALTRHHGQ